MQRTYFLVPFLFLFITGCTVGTPSLTSLSEFSGITFTAEKKLTLAYTINTSPTCKTDLVVTGQCDQRLNQLQFSVDGQTTWTNITGYNSTSDGDCSDGEFKLYFPDVCQAMGVADGANVAKKIQIHGDKKMAQNVTREVSINFTTDNPVLTKISVNSPAAFLEGGSVNFAVSLDAPASKPVTVQYNLVLGSAISADLTSLPSGTLTFAVGETVKSIAVSTVDNSVVCEPTKTFFLDLSNPSANSEILTNHGATSFDDPDRPVLNVVDNNGSGLGQGSATEGSLGNMRVSLSALCPTHDVTFYWATFDGTATLADLDYTRVTSTLATISMGTSSVLLPVHTTADSTNEPDEYLTVGIESPTEATIGINTGTFYIMNDDSLPNLSINTPASVLEGSALTFNVSLSAMSSSTVTVNYTIAHVTTNDADFQTPPSGGTLTFIAGQTLKTITYNTFDDAIYEPDQTFTVTLSSPVNAGISTSIGTGTITSDEAMPTISLSAGPSVTEGSNAVFTINMNRQSDVPINFDYATSSITAVSPGDFTSTSGTATILALATSKTITVATIDDSIDEPDETFSLSISNPVNAFIGTSSSVATLQDNDPTPSFSIASNGVVTEGSPSLFTITLSAPSQQKFTVDYSTTSGTATAGSDFNSASSVTVTFNPGDTTKVISITTIDDVAIEGDETFTVTLSNPLNTTLSGGSGVPALTTSSAVGTINDNDSLAAPTSISLLTVTNFPSVIESPKYRIDGAVQGETVRIMLGNCSGTVVASGNVSFGNTFADLSVAPFSSDGTYNLFAHRDNGTSISPCIAAPVYSFKRLLVEPVYISAQNWNDYFPYALSLNDIFHQVDSPCAGTETGYLEQLGGCAHGGEKRKVVIFGQTSCAGLTITESLGVFDWKCMIDSTTNLATFYSVGLKSGKGLRDLIDSSPAWKSNSVQINQSSTIISSTISAPWWTNLILSISATPGLDNSATSIVKLLSTPGTIYVATADITTYGYNITASNIAVVNLGFTKFKKYEPSNTNNCDTSGLFFGVTIDTMFCSSSQKFNWLEVNIDGVSGTANPVSYGLFLSGWSYSRINNVTVSPVAININAAAVTLKSSSKNLVTGLTIHTAASGLELNASTSNTIRNLGVSNAKGAFDGTTSINLNSNSNLNHFYDVRVSNPGSPSNSTSAILLSLSSYNVFNRVTEFNLIGNTSSSKLTEGLQLAAGSTNNIFTQLLVSFGTDSGILLTGNGVSNNIFSQVTLLNNYWNAIYFGAGDYNNNGFISLVGANQTKAIESDTGATSSTTTNILRDAYLTNSSNYAVDVSQNGLLSLSGFMYHGTESACAGGGGDSSTICLNLNSRSGADLSSAFFGRVVSDDTKNPDDGGAGFFSGTYTSLSASGALDFDFMTRGWGTSAGYSFPNSALRNSTLSNLGIWDFRPLSGAGIYNRSYSGSSANGSTPVDGSTCGVNTVLMNDFIVVGGVTFLRNAIEIDGDGVGNDNGVCESNEDCVYAPNIGAYQGSGGITAGYCIPAGSAGLSNIRIFKYNTN